MVLPLWKSVWWYLEELNAKLSYDSAILFLGGCVYIHRIKRTEKSIYIESKELKNHARTKTHMCMLIPALFKTARKWEQEKDK